MKKNSQIQGQMDLFNFVEPRPEQMPMKDYLTRLGFKNEYFEKPDHECLVEVADIHEYPNVHFYDAKYVLSFGNIVQEYPQKCGYECHWWREKEKIYPLDIRGICDDAYCPQCDMGIDEFKFMDCKRCPHCGCLISWEPWHRANDKENERIWGKDWRERFGKNNNN